MIDPEIIKTYKQTTSVLNRRFSDAHVDRLEHGCQTQASGPNLAHAVIMWQTTNTFINITTDSGLRSSVCVIRKTGDPTRGSFYCKGMHSNIYHPVAQSHTRNLDRNDFNTWFLLKCI